MLIKKLLLIILALIFFVASFLLEFVVSYVLPYPFSTLNILSAMLLMYLLWRERGMVVWLSFFIHFLAELLTPKPFGVVLFAGTMSFFVAYWLLRNVFISRSWYIAPILTVITLCLYRGIELLFHVGAVLLTSQTMASLRLVDTPLLAEIVGTTLLVTLAYVLVLFVSKRLNTKLIYDAQIH